MVPNSLATQFKSGSKQVEIARKAGSVRSDRKKLGARLRHLKEKGLTDETCRLIYEAMTDANMDALDQYLYLKKLQNEASDVEERTRVLALWLKWHEDHHGKKEKLEIKEERVQVIIHRTE
jgi:hypothetical protein